ncbi:phage/plasmid primase, P4 family [Arthrobacter sulfonylureivorans]|uniref:Phage/plasmid primase, P4 family n=1 Tax=Arthrobacter sulfonylureivorans TaxID=2486855 RepID=A0ABY3WD48_9MICC|nr:phage/plasmid primase, P4 family [Arthrobacter sulfonylureivorans]UNK47120.1 phage/plasmid primase, P4 family [Arthrobacter sulfonylureivorans]
MNPTDTTTLPGPVAALHRLGVPVFTAPPGGNEFKRPTGWQNFRPEDNPARLLHWQPGHAIMGVLGGRVAVLDVDTKNGASIDNARALLAGLGITVFAEIATPSGGRHYYIAGHPDLPSIAAQDGKPGLAGHPGVEILSHGRNAFLPGTSRPKYGGAGYTVVHDNLDALADGGDPNDGGQTLAEWAAANRVKPATARTPAAPAWDGTPPDRRQTAYLASALEKEAATVAGTTEGGRNHTLNNAAFSLGGLIAGAGLDESETVAALTTAAEACGLTRDDGPAQVAATIRSGIRAGGHHPRPVPAADQGSGLGTTWPIRGSRTTETPADPEKTDRMPLDDARLAGHIGYRLKDRYCWAGGMGWLHYTGKAWAAVTNATMTERVRQEHLELFRAATTTADADRARKLAVLLAVSKIRAVAGLLRGILETDPADFDARPDLLNVRNGTVDLATGQLQPHNPTDKLTKTAGADYRPDATSADWTQALRAVPDEVAAWLQVRFGQAATGHMTPDDIMPVMQGGGQNGKTTVLAGISAALGEHAVTVPDRLLLANPSDHPTELTTLQGARLAVIEETPEGRRLNVKRLKDILGTPTITARRIRQDNITWHATHSLFLATNYRPVISDTDHGTWRRLALVRFPFTFHRPDRPHPDGNGHLTGDPALRQRITQKESREAALAWIVAGAQAWYAAGQTMPPAPAAVEADSLAWRAESDLVLAYIQDRLQFDPDSAVLTTELHEDFSDWLRRHGHTAWSDQTFTARFADHSETTTAGVTKTRKNDPSNLSRRDFLAPTAMQGKQRIWAGLAFTGPGRTGALREPPYRQPHEGHQTPPVHPGPAQERPEHVTQATLQNSACPLHPTDPLAGCWTCDADKP